MRALGLFVAVIAASCSALGCGGSGGDSAGVIGNPGSSLSASFEPDEPTPAVGTVSMREASRSNDIVTVQVAVTGTTSLFGAGFDVVFDPASVEFVGYAPGSALEAAPTGSVVYEVSLGAGSLVVGAALIGTDNGVDVSGTLPLVQLTFRVLQAGAAEISFDGVPALLDDQPEPQPIPGLNWFGGTLIGE